jgi:acyl-CoA synthetase (AMP-forming)/AMP-acid ligase II
MGLAVTDILTFDGFLVHWAGDRPKALALREEDRSFSYADLEDRTARVASALLAAGLQKGDRIAWIGKNSDLYFTLFYGAARAGIVMVPIGWRLAPAEWAYVLKDTGAKILFTGLGFDSAGNALAGQLADVGRDD